MSGQAIIEAALTVLADGIQKNSREFHSLVCSELCDYVDYEYFVGLINTSPDQIHIYDGGYNAYPTLTELLEG